MMLLRSLLFTCISLPVMFVLTVAGLACLPFSRRTTARFPIIFAVIQLKLLDAIVGIRTEIRGNLPESPSLIAVKHQSALEAYILVTRFPDAVIVLKKELVSFPLVGPVIAALDPIAVDRNSGAPALRKMVAEAKNAARHGRHVIIFPEGMRTIPGAPSRYERGIAALYTALGINVVPVALNTGLFWPRRRLRKRSGTAVISFLEPIPPTLPRNEFLKRLESAIENESDLLHCTTRR